MARSFYSDPMMVCQFALVEVPTATLSPLAFPFKTINSALSQGNFIGFQSISIPEFTLETKDIKQGNSPHIQKVIVGFESGGNVVLKQAVLSQATDMFFWWQQAVRGVLAPRRHMMVTHVRADRRLPARVIVCSNCIPVAWKPADDFDASNSAVSMESLTLWTQCVNIVPGLGETQDLVGMQSSIL